MPPPPINEHTLARPFSLSGHGLHTGRRSSVTIAPAPPGHGVRFAMADAAGGSVLLSWEHRVSSRLNTALGLPDGSRLRTIEHLAASLSAFQVDNALVTVAGREIPILDGSAAPWCAGLAQAGLERQPALRRAIRVTRPIQVAVGERFVRLEPAPDAEIDVTCLQHVSGDTLRWQGRPTRDVFVAELSRSRSSAPAMTAIQVGLIERMRRAGLLRDGANGARRASKSGEANRPQHDLVTPLPPGLLERLEFPSDEPVLRGARPGRVAVWVGPWVLGGKRYPDEVARHVALDLIGDLRLAGAPILGRVVAHAPTHRLTYACVATLMQSPDAWEWHSG